MCLAIIGGAVSAAGALASASAQSSAYKAQSQFEQRQSVMDLQAGAYKAAREKAVNDQKISGAQASYLSNGIALEGSPDAVLQSGATQASLDQEAIKYGAQVQSGNDQFSANLARANASSAMTAGYIGAASSIIGGFTKQAEMSKNATTLGSVFGSF